MACLPKVQIFFYSDWKTAVNWNTQVKQKYVKLVLNYSWVNVLRYIPSLVIDLNTLFSLNESTWFPKVKIARGKTFFITVWVKLASYGLKVSDFDLMQQRERGGVTHVIYRKKTHKKLYSTMITVTSRILNCIFVVWLGVWFQMKYFNCNPSVNYLLPPPQSTRLENPEINYGGEGGRW